MSRIRTFGMFFPCAQNLKEIYLAAQLETLPTLKASQDQCMQFSHQHLNGDKGENERGEKFLSKFLSRTFLSGATTCMQSNMSYEISVIYHPNLPSILFSPTYSLGSAKYQEALIPSRNNTKRFLHSGCIE